MRDFLILAIVLGSVPICLFRPYYGVLLWVWIAYFNPHRFAWTYAYNFPVAMTVAVPTLLGILFTKELNRKFLTREVLLLLLLWGWFVVTLVHATQVPLFAGHVADALAYMTRVSKILLMTMVMILLVNTRLKLKYLTLVTAFCFAVLAIKGALFALRTSGEARIWGPADSFIGDNNAFGLALNMTLPMFYYFAREEENRLFRRILRLSFVAGIVCVLLTYSRGGLLGLAVVLTCIALKSHYKILSAVFLLSTATVLLSFAPAMWMQRMGQLASGEIDESGRQRIITWETGWRFVQDHPIAGGGFETLPDPVVFQRYQPEPLPGGFQSSGPHSIYVQMLSEQGFVGLFLFLLLVGSSWFTFRSLRRRIAFLPSAQWLIPYTHMFEVGLLGYLVSGAFLGFAYFDLFYQFMASAAILRILFLGELRAAFVPAPEEQLILVPVAEHSG